MEFSNENVINAVQNRPLLWDTAVNASEEEKDLAWKEIVLTAAQLANITQVQAIRTSSSSAMLTYAGRVEGK